MPDVPALDPSIIAALREVPATLQAVHQALINVEDPIVTNEGSGALVLARYGPVLARSGTPERRHRVFVDVDSDVGRLTFPVFDRFIWPAIRDTGCWEPAEAAYIRSHLRPGDCALDIGANVGYSALVMSKAVGTTGLVVALEPEPLNYELLCRNLHRSGAHNVVPVHSAAGERTGTAILERSPDNCGDHRTAPNPMSTGSLEVPMVTIDELLEGGLDVDLVLIDAQGYDHRVIRGLAGTAARCRPRILTEFWPSGIRNVGDDPDEALGFYLELDYRLTLVSGRDVSDCGHTEILELADPGYDYVTLVLEPLGASA